MRHARPRGPESGGGEVAGVLDEVDRALVSVVSGPDGLPELRRAVDLLSDTMTSHLAYEERELIGPLARHGFYG